MASKVTEAIAKTNKYQAQHNSFFKECCLIAEAKTKIPVRANARQFSKFKNGKGLAFTHKAYVMAGMAKNK